MGDVFGSERARVDLHVVANVTLGFRTAGGSRRNHACTADLMRYGHAAAVT